MRKAVVAGALVIALGLAGLVAPSEAGPRGNRYGPVQRAATAVAEVTTDLDDPAPVLVYVAANEELPEWFDAATFATTLLAELPPGSQGAEAAFGDKAARLPSLPARARQRKVVAAGFDGWLQIELTGRDAEVELAWTHAIGKAAKSSSGKLAFVPPPKPLADGRTPPDRLAALAAMEDLGSQVAEPIQTVECLVAAPTDGDAGNVYRRLCAAYDPIVKLRFTGRDAADARTLRELQDELIPALGEHVVSLRERHEGTRQHAAAELLSGFALLHVATLGYRTRCPYVDELTCDDWSAGFFEEALPAFDGYLVKGRAAVIKALPLADEALVEGTARRVGKQVFELIEDGDYPFEPGSGFREAFAEDLSFRRAIEEKTKAP